MKIKLVIRTKWDDKQGGETWDRVVERPYPGVPLPGDVVALSDNEAWKHFVDKVRWKNDGTIVLEFGPFVDADYPESKLKESMDWAGFEQVLYNEQGQRIKAL